MMVQGGETMDSEDTNSEVASPLKAPDMLDESAIQRQMNIVVSGVSCRLPRCRNMAEFRKMLLENRNINIDKDCELDISLLSVNHGWLNVQMNFHSC
ncbi:hypothetical protein DPMN_034379 [Dreissena polymorpha]|uniref:Uncharacterized protein n=1 Tax=Dreissena polymorpha TaxID=45954 RepID=A0A9D4RM14_DREPO|nr:hypothetical protein DPMN_034379 [Dreissena polymorpha]